MEGIERIKILANQVKDPALLKIVEHLLSREDMNEKYLNETKNLKNMCEFIKQKIQKKSKTCMVMVEDEVVYSIAIHYWDEENKELDIKMEQEEAKDIKPIKKVQKKEWIPEGQLSLF